MAAQPTGHGRTQTRSSTNKHDDHGLHEGGLGGDAHEVPGEGHQWHGARHGAELLAEGWGGEEGKISPRHIPKTRYYVVHLFWSGSWFRRRGQVNARLGYAV